jgi:PhzF family phenazine biosynthesis protein
VRIFTPRAELPFAGHPTLGTAHAVIEAGMASPKQGLLVQQCAVGLVQVAVAADSLSFTLPAHRFEEVPEPEVIVMALGGAGVIQSGPRIVHVGPRWVIAELASAALVEALEPDLAALAAYDRTHATTGITVYATGGAGDITVRSFAPADGIAEDPVCGSGNGAVAAFRRDAGQVKAGDAYLSSQGRQVGRDGRVAVRFGTDTIHVGGQCVTLIDGILRL